MRLKITHRTEYSYEQPLAYALQRLRLFPCSGPLQTVHSWALAIDGAREEVRFVDHFGNDTRLISVAGEPHVIGIEAAGEVETFNKAGVSGPQRGFAPLWLFLRETPLTAPDEKARELAAAIAKDAGLGGLHELMAAVHASAAPAAPAEKATQMQTSGAPASQVQASEASATPTKDTASIQEHAHGFIAAARLLGFPARYVSGYLMVDGIAGQATSHAWAEAHVEGLGWVGFDAVHGISPDENYVRVATGRDHRDAMPVSGIPLGQASEQLAVRITVEQ